MFVGSVRPLATSVKPSFKTVPPPKFTLASLRSFPSLEPHEFIPLPTSFFNVPIRKDLLWSAVVYEADRARVGSNYAITKSDQPYSHKKLRPQKGSGKARVGDNNSPSRYNEIKAHVIKGPHDWSTSLPRKIYSKAFQNAFSDQYRNGRLFIVGGTKKVETDDLLVDFKYSFPAASEQFVAKHNLDGLNLLFITEGDSTNLRESTEPFGRKVRVIKKEDVEVRDILKAHRIYTDLLSLRWFISKYSIE